MPVQRRRCQPYGDAQHLGDTAAGRLDQLLVGLATDEPPAPPTSIVATAVGPEPASKSQTVAPGRLNAWIKVTASPTGCCQAWRVFPGFRFFQSIVEDRIEVEVSFAENDDWHPSIYNLIPCRTLLTCRLATTVHP